MQIWPDHSSAAASTPADATKRACLTYNGSPSTKQAGRHPLECRSVCSCSQQIWLVCCQRMYNILCLIEYQLGRFHCLCVAGSHTLGCGTNKLVTVVVGRWERVACRGQPCIVHSCWLRAQQDIAFACGVPKRQLYYSCCSGAHTSTGPQLGVVPAAQGLKGAGIGGPGERRGEA